MNMIELFIYTFLISIITLVMFIPKFRKIKISQYEREEGPKSHLSKQGTPTLGGLIIILVVTFVFIIVSIKQKFEIGKMITILFPLVSFGLIGLIDDYLVIKKRNNKGLSWKTKIVLEVIISIIYLILLEKNGHFYEVKIFNLIINNKILYYLFFIFIMVGASNAVNLTDGLDGLAGGLSLLNLLSIIFLTINTNKEINYFSFILISSLLAFMCFNYHPARIFMGDTGSLALGATIASLFIVLKYEFFIIIFMNIFIIEVLSVIVQILYFKKTKGKRLLLMAPLHHHYELKGFSELKVDFIFWIFGILMNLLGLFLIYKFY